MIPSSAVYSCPPNPSCPLRGASLGAVPIALILALGPCKVLHSPLSSAQLHMYNDEISRKFFKPHCKSARTHTAFPATLLLPVELVPEF